LAKWKNAIEWPSPAVSDAGYKLPVILRKGDSVPPLKLNDLGFRDWRE